jgi:hypothetical protein
MSMYWVTLILTSRSTRSSPGMWLFLLPISDYAETKPFYKETRSDWKTEENTYNKRKHKPIGNVVRIAFRNTLQKLARSLQQLQLPPCILERSCSCSAGSVKRRCFKNCKNWTAPEYEWNSLALCRAYLSIYIKGFIQFCWLTAEKRNRYVLKRVLQLWKLI